MVKGKREIKVHRGLGRGFHILRKRCKCAHGALFADVSNCFVLILSYNILYCSRMRKRIIIFDDDKDTLAICSLILSGLDFEVITQESCIHILDILDVHAPQVILIDNHLPGMNGAAGIRLVKESARHRHIPIIFFTGTNNAQELADEAGADFVLPKPVDLARLEEVIALAINN